MADKDETSREGITIKVDVDISEALTGLKALQREAKKATQGLRELEEAQKGVNQPIVVAPLTVGDVPAHIKQYGDVDQTYRATGHVDAWFNTEGDGD